MGRQNVLHECRSALLDVHVLAFTMILEMIYNQNNQKFNGNFCPASRHIHVQFVNLLVSLYFYSPL